MQGGTTFHFVTEGFDAAYARAREAAGDGEIGIAGGASTIRQALAAGVLDELTLDVSPVLLGAGERLFDGVADPGLTPIEVTSSPYATHLHYRVGTKPSVIELVPTGVEPERGWTPEGTRCQGRRMRQEDLWDVTAAQRYDTPGTGMFAPEVLGPTVDRLAELAGGGRALELAIGTGRVGRAAGRARGPGHRHRAVPPDGRPAAHQGRRGRDPGGRRRHGDRTRARRVHARLSRLQHDLQPAHPGRAGRVLPQRRPPPEPGRPLRDRAVGARAAHAPAGSRGHGLARRARLHRLWTRTTSCTSDACRTTSRSATAARPSWSAVRTATSGRPSST